jgi:hypothetical protein
LKILPFKIPFKTDDTMDMYNQGSEDDADAAAAKKSPWITSLKLISIPGIFQMALQVPTRTQDQQ